MDAVAELGAEDGVDELMLLDAALSRECGGHDLGAEVLSVTGDLGARVGQTGLDAILDLVRGDHGSHGSGERYPF